MTFAQSAAPLLTMIQINDVHVDPGEDRDNSRGKLAAFVRTVAGNHSIPHPDMLLLAGDLVHLPTEESFSAFDELMRPLADRPVLAVPGNHDLARPSDPQPDTPFTRHISAETLGRVLLHKGLLLILLNNADGDACMTPALEERNAWLAEQLARHADLPKLIACHVPLVAMREPHTLATSFDFPTWKPKDPQEQVLRIIEQHQETVIAVLSGHLHLTGRVERNGIQHIVASGLVSWPHHCPLYEIYPDRLEARMLSPEPMPDPGALAQYPLQNGIHDRHGEHVVFTDPRHPSFAQYIAGTPDEQSFTIPLEGKKRIRGVA